VGLFDKKTSNKASEAKLESLLKQAFPDADFFKQDNGTLSIREDSVGISIFINENFGDGSNIVTIVGFTIFGARDEDALYRHLLTNTEISIQAHWEVDKAEVAGTVDIMVIQNLLLETLDVLELQVAVAGVTDSANNNDEAIQKLFGGKRCVEHFGWNE
jgi:hypothetical protein